MVAFLSRLEAKSQFYGDRYDFRRLFDRLTAEKGVGYMRWLVMFADEKRIKGLSEDIERRKRVRS